MSFTDTAGPPALAEAERDGVNGCMVTSAEQPHLVDDLMTDDLITVEPTDTIGQGRDLILTLGIHALPVVDADSVVGIVTSPDLADDWAENLPVSMAMSSPVYRIDADATLRTAAEQMLALNVHHLIVEGRDRVGIITSFDLLRAFSSSAPN